MMGVPIWKAQIPKRVLIWKAVMPMRMPAWKAPIPRGMLTWKARFIQSMVLSLLLHSTPFSSPLMQGTRSAKGSFQGLGLGVHTQAGIHGWLQKAQ